MKKLIILLILMIIPSICFAGSASRSFDGVSDSIDFSKPSGLTVGTDSFTRMIWIKWGNGTDNDETIFSQQDGTGTGRNWLNVDETGVCGAGNKATSVLGGTNSCSSTSIPNGSWQHVAVRSNETAGTVDIIQDGVETGSNTRTVESATGNLRTGVHKTNTAQDFNGLMAYNILCKGAITNSQINEIKFLPENAGAYCGSGYYNFAPFWGTSPEQDLSGNGNTGTVNGATTSSDGPPLMFGGGLPL